MLEFYYRIFSEHFQVNLRNIQKKGEVKLNLYEVIYQISKEKNISINQLEEKAGLSTGSIYKWNTVSPTVKNLKKVAEVLETTVDSLLEKAS